MSYVTNVILHVGLFDEHRVDEVNEFFERKEIRGFVAMDDESLPDGWYGGTKYLEGCFSVGAFNSLDMPALLEHIRGIDWWGPHAVQLIVLDQEDYKCRIIEVFPEAQALYEQPVSLISDDDVA